MSETSRHLARFCFTGLSCFSRTLFKATSGACPEDYTFPHLHRTGWDLGPWRWQFAGALGVWRDKRSEPHRNRQRFDVCEGHVGCASCRLRCSEDSAQRSTYIIQSGLLYVIDVGSCLRFQTTRGNMVNAQRCMIRLSKNECFNEPTGGWSCWYLGV